MSDTHATMSQATFDQLKDCSAESPARGFYGMMWKQNATMGKSRARHADGEEEIWMLGFVGASSNEYRRIVIV